MLSVERLEHSLNARPFRYMDRTGSTNDTATQWLNDGASDGCVVVANEQVQGRGRLGRTWYAPPGTALTFSYILHPSEDDLPYVGMMGALAVLETITTLGIDSVGIKWPNDVQISGRKVCGILPEATWQGSRLLGVVLGIGINVRIDFADTPFQQTAVSLESLVSPIDRTDLLRRLVERLDHCSAHLNSDELFERWRDALVVMGQHVSISGVSGTLEGIAESVDRQGALTVRDAGGTLQRVIAGDIALG